MADPSQRKDQVRRIEYRPLRWRVDVYCSGGWQWLASFSNETDAYEYGSRQLNARVWDLHTGVCIAECRGARSWRPITHDRNCNGAPCECGAVPPLGSKARNPRALAAFRKQT